MSDAGNWCLIESDPGVFTELIAGFGVKGVQVKEIWGLDSITGEELKPVYGLIFLFKWQADKLTPAPASSEGDDHVFFANQVINNACATQAILSILLNQDSIDIGDELRKFKAFTADFPPDIKGEVLSNSDVIRSVHNSFARSEPFVNDMSDPNAGKDEDVFHFIAYMPIHGALYELDGLSKGPINHGPCTDNDWTARAKEVIADRIQRYGEGALHFSLMALTRDRIDVYEEQLKNLQKVPDNHELCIQLEEALQDEKHERERWKRESRLRKHNFIPLIYNLLRLSAEHDMLDGLVAKGKEKAKSKGNGDQRGGNH